MSLITYQFKCCFGPYGCSCFCIRPVRISTTTRSMYCLILIGVSIAMICVHEKRVLNFMVDQVGSQFNETCITIKASQQCERLFGYKSVYRIACCFSLFHLFMMLLCIYVSNGNNWRAKIHNGFWFFKFLVILATWFNIYWFELMESYAFYVTIVGVVAAFLFIVLQHVSLIDFAYETNEYFRRKSEKNCCFDVLLIITTCVLYLITVGGYIVIYIHFASIPVCIKNRIVIFVNAAASLSLVLFSFLVTKHIRFKLYLPAAITCVFVMFITWTAISSAPYQTVSKSYELDATLNSTSGSEQYHMKPYDASTKLFLCQPEFLYKSSSSDSNNHLTKELHTYLGICVMLLTAVYSSVKSTSDYQRYGIKPSRSKRALATNLQTITEDVELQEMPKSRHKLMSAQQFNNNNRSGLVQHKAQASHKVFSGSEMFLGTRCGSIENMNSSGASSSNKSWKTISMPSLNTLPRLQMTNLATSSSDSAAKLNQKIVNKRAKKSSKMHSSDTASPIDSYFSPLVNQGEFLPEPNVIEDTLRNYPLDKFLIHDEYFSVRYSYSWLHLIFALAYLFVMVQLTNWYSPSTSHLVPFQQSWPSMWMKITTSWIALALYGWTLLCPAFCMGRKLYEFPLDSIKRMQNRQLSSAV